MSEDKRHEVLNKLVQADRGILSSGVRPVSLLPTGLRRLDKCVLGGGVPLGRLVELAGETGAGKTTLAQIIAGEMQKSGGLVAWVDAETSFDPAWAAKSGMDVEKTILRQSDVGDKLLRWIKTMAVVFGEEVGRGLIVVDSAAGIIPEIVVGRVNERKKMNEETAQAKLLGQFNQDLISTFKVDDADLGINGEFRLGDYDVTILFINHLKEGKEKFPGGPPERYTAGGVIKNFAASLRLWLYRLKDDKERIEGGGVRRMFVKMMAEKTRFAPPRASCKLWLNHETGRFDEDWEFILGEAIEKGLATKSGSWITITGTGEKFQGLDAFEDYCLIHSGFLDQIFEKEVGGE